MCLRELIAGNRGKSVLPLSEMIVVIVLRPITSGRNDNGERLSLKIWN